MRNLILALAASAAIAAPAFAQDGPPPAPDTFTGAHVEVLTGVDRVRGGGRGDTSLAYGVAGGYDFQTANGTVFGVEGEFADSNGKKCDNGVLAAGDRVCYKSKRDLYAGGRVGFVSGRTLIYGKAGYTNARFGTSYDDGVAGTGPLDGSGSGNLDGVRVGGGLETNIGNFLVKGEYRYSNYEQGVSRHQGLVGVGVRF